MDSVASPYAYAMMLPQSDAERLLEERLQRLGVSVERSMGPRRSQLGATAWRRRFAARMAAKRNPCGLARRMRRRTQHCAPHARGSLSGETLNSDWILADVHMKGYPFPIPRSQSIGRATTCFRSFPISPGRYRVIANITPNGGDHPRDPTPEEIQTIVERRGPRRASLFDPIWLSGFRTILPRVRRSSFSWGRVRFS
jgi:hypothetical protein